MRHTLCFLIAGIALLAACQQQAPQKTGPRPVKVSTVQPLDVMLPILDVLSAQLAWIQAYSNLIQVRLQQKVSLADYQKAIGKRDPER